MVKNSKASPSKGSPYQINLGETIGRGGREKNAQRMENSLIEAEVSHKTKALK